MFDDIKWKFRELKWKAEELFSCDNDDEPEYSSKTEAKRRKKARKKVVKKIVTEHRGELIKSLNQKYTETHIGYVDNNGLAHFDQLEHERELLINAIADLSNEIPLGETPRETQRVFPIATKNIVKSIAKSANKSYGKMAGIDYDGEYTERNDPFLQAVKQVVEKQKRCESCNESSGKCQCNSLSPVEDQGSVTPVLGNWKKFSHYP